MPEDARKIEIFKPFGEAYELMKKILFRPFDLGKWCVIGFAAFLASLAGGFHFNFNTGRGDFKTSIHTMRNDVSNSAIGDWLLPIIIVAVVLGLLLGVLFLWLGSRGRFIFTDCIVRNRAAIGESWKEFRAEGNRFFVLNLLFGLVLLLCLAPFFLTLFWPALWRGEDPQFGVGQIVAMVFGGLLVLFVTCLWGLLRTFMVPLMYRQRCQAATALREAIGLVRGRPGVCVLYFLFYLVIAVATGIGMFLLMCATCCITAIPYVSSVVFLPVSVTLTALGLLFVRQFGPDADVWLSPRALPPVPPRLPSEGLPPPADEGTPPPDVPPVQS